MRAEASPSGPQDALSDSNAGRPAELPEGLPQAARQALEDLRQAAQSKKVEAICNAYRTLREAGRGMKVKDLLELADKALGQQASLLIVSAFSHLHCYMCNDGSSICDQCEGTGRLEQNRKCPQCEGFGVLSCNFCKGSGWAERSVIPPELRRAVLDRQLLNLRGEVKKLGESFSYLTVDRINRLLRDKRRELISWLIRLQARMTEMAGMDELVDPLEKAQLTASAARISSRLEELEDS
jgi:hypothetical protein